MAKQPATKKAAAITTNAGPVSDEALDKLLEGLETDLRGSIVAQEKLAGAKEALPEELRNSTRKFAERLAGLNGDLTEEQIDTAGKMLAPRLYTNPGTIKKEASNISKLIRNRRHLIPIIDELDKIGADKKKLQPGSAPVNIRSETTKVCTALQDHAKKVGPVDDKVLATLLANARTSLIKAAPSDAEKAIALLDRLSELDVLMVSVGTGKNDAKAHKPGIEKALNDIRDTINNVPLPLEQDSKQLKAENEELREELDAKNQEIAELNERLAKASLTPAEPASGPLTVGETEGHPTTGDSPEALDDLATRLPGASEVAKPAKAAKDRREDAVKGSVMGPEGDFLGLLGGLGIKG